MSFGDNIVTAPPPVTGGYPVVVSEVAPPNPYEGMAWFKASTNTLQIYTKGAWKAAASGAGTGLPPANKIGDLLIADAGLSWVATPKIDNGRF